MPGKKAEKLEAPLSPNSSIDCNDCDYPEGGYRAWLVVLGAWCMLLPPMGLLNGLGILQAWTFEHQLHGYSESSIGWIFSTYGFFVFAAGAQAGPIFDTYGVQIAIIPGSIGLVVSLICFSFSTEYYQMFLSFSILGGLSGSTLYTPVIACVGHWFNQRRAFATGVALTAGGFGGAIFSVIILFAAPTIGFEWAIRIYALLTVLLCTCGCFLLRTRLPPNTKAGASVDFRALRDVRYAITVLAIFLIEFSFMIPFSYIPSYARHVGLDSEMSWLLTIIISLSGIPGRSITGLVADRIGRFNSLVVTSLICSALTLALWLPAGNDLKALICYAIFFGYWCGAGFSLAPVSVSQVCDTADYGKRNGTAYTVASIGTLISIPVGGAIIERAGGDYWGVIVFGGGLYFASMMAFFAARVICVGWNLRIIF
ncbi:putative monocarboxylate transporter [Aspergillus campestris IBT 28561]|uniref:Monocarboxylate transporter n=1 Tax=Aspergillus campestris (strain IBT 28561) TaxID=1392248 RepID=A0A2I1CS38_ASPC2|nr:putative monocarboxylate transporter [Aspergillus campestris IBT 28561]PKY00439.1 putative monocarboxylate transporter [Aspergillus campestris IBT 28561]